jgi:aminoglycoside phosphotransferase (APT) family kinase protein
VTQPQEVRGLPRESFTAWAREALPGLGDDWRAEVIGGGLSNITYRLTGGDRSVIVRRPPTGKLLPSAHDMMREAKVLTALQDTAVPVPEVLAVCADDTVAGAPFYVMAEVPGEVLREPEEAAYLTAGQRNSLVDALVETLAAIHAVDLDATGLRDFGKSAGYLERQVRRWSGQWEASRTRELPAMDELVRRLQQERPAEGEVTLVHGDFRHDNCLLAIEGSAAPRVAAVVDWELSTLGDPLADLATWLTYYTGRDDEGQPLIVGAGVPALEGFPAPEEVASRYAAATGRDVSGLAYYRAFSDFRLAVIAEGVHARYLAGQADGPGYDRAGASVPLMVDRALSHLVR